MSRPRLAWAQKFAHRDLTWPLVTFRNWCFGREVINPNRFADEQSSHNPPPPQIPGGPYHKLSNVYYYARDGRREMQPPTLVLDKSKEQLLGAGGEGLPSSRTDQAKEVGKIKFSRPGTGQSPQNLGHAR
ncbi:hypothetical protein RvY_03270 [Ramazzottius varieornatus]|uniref:NADH dehydrogenase [ubiquinone] 1 alpha subcomplex subunit 7 n=1 Tax=Ramazzottius varieornatus TaxID=947166 RepID=A0A1D1UMG0_RAMVA|nr:hypothetical protein RvY_03270 [Ramazzottius varieornatus]